jgi:hypothetical protein
MTAPAAGGDRPEESDPTRGAAAEEPAARVAETTVGTGSALGIGCVVALVALVLVAFAVRWLTGAW